MVLFRILLFPFAVLYDLITRARNHLYNKGLKPSASFDVPLIAVGNLTVGGTGKTPMVEYLIRLLSPHGKVATLSRGYGRKTKGTRLAGDTDNAATLGDEPFQFYNKFGDKVTVAVGEDRALAVPVILDSDPTIRVIVLDDAFQHRRVMPALNILLTDYNRPFYSDFLIPSGYLRESKVNARRADVVVVTKCPVGLAEEEMLEIEKRIRIYASAPVFFSVIGYGAPVSFGKSLPSPDEKVILVTGIADARPFREYVSDKFTVVKHFSYRDHHVYTQSDLLEICSMAGDGVSVITTEKDMVKMNAVAMKPMVESVPFFYIPIETSFIRNGQEFDAIVLDVTRQNTESIYK